MEIGECIAAPAAPVLVPPLVAPTWHAKVLLKSVTFTGNHAVEQDTTGTFASRPLSG